jgi:hypothetical protein
MRGSLLLPVLALAALASSCTDPVHDAEVNALGGEVGGIPQGEYHRAGQPCAACHGSEGPAKTTFTLAGTVFYGPNAAIGVDGVAVEFYDARGATFVAHTNCVGNFFVSAAEFDPYFPVAVQINKGSNVPMVSHIGRDASCANCHKDPTYVDTPGHIHLVNADVEKAMPPTPAQCPVNPVLSAGVTK